MGGGAEGIVAVQECDATMFNRAVTAGPMTGPAIR